MWEMKEEVFGLKQGLSGELFLKNQAQKKNGKAVASLVFCPPSFGRSLCSSHGLQLCSQAAASRPRAS